MTLGVGARGSPALRFQWLLDNRPISGATQSNLALVKVTAQDTGNPVPRWEQVVEWVRNHPEEAKELMENRDQGFPSSAR